MNFEFRSCEWIPGLGCIVEPGIRLLIFFTVGNFEASYPPNSALSNGGGIFSSLHISRKWLCASSHGDTAEFQTKNIRWILSIDLKHQAFYILNLKGNETRGL